MLEKIELPASIKKIGENAFSDTLISSIKIPENIRSFDFSGCFNLSEIIIPPSVKIKQFGGFSLCPKLESITIPDSVRKIKSSAFSYSGLKNIIIPDSVETIGELAFYSCGKLESVTCGKGINLLERKRLPTVIRLANLLLKR